MNRTNIKLAIVFGAPLFLWCWWMLESIRLNLRVFIREEAPDAMIVITVSALIGLFVAWRHMLRGHSSAFREQSLYKTFISGFLFAAITLWCVPEAWVRLTAREVITDKVTFSVEHPGPAIGRNSHCQAGLRFYDDWLKYYVELCTKDLYLVSGARTVEIEKRVTTHGAYFTRYRFVFANGTPDRWIKV